MSNPSGTDYTTMWHQNDSSASVTLENDTLEIITNSYGLQKSPGRKSPDSTRVVIKIKVDRQKMLKESIQTDNRSQEITGELYYQGQAYPMYGTWSFAQKSNPGSLYINFSIGHKKSVRIPIRLEEFKIFVLTDFLFEAVNVPVLIL